MSELETGWEAQAGHGGYRTVPNVAEIKKGIVSCEQGGWAR